jgi:predicted enzyme related to lactoylglutathione lyase
MKIKHVYLTSHQPNQLAEFYTKLGLAIRFADGERWVQFRSDSGAAAFCISGLGESAAPPSSNAVVVFEVEKLETAVEVAVTAGAIVLQPIRDMGDHGRVAKIQDPANNIIQFFEASTKPKG